MQELAAKWKANSGELLNFRVFVFTQQKVVCMGFKAFKSWSKFWFSIYMSQTIDLSKFPLLAIHYATKMHAEKNLRLSIFDFRHFNDVDQLTESEFCA